MPTLPCALGVGCCNSKNPGCNPSGHQHATSATDYDIQPAEHEAAALETVRSYEMKRCLYSMVEGKKCKLQNHLGHRVVLGVNIAQRRAHTGGFTNMC